MLRPIRSPSVYPLTVPQAPGDPTLMLFPSTRMWELRDPGVPYRQNNLAGQLVFHVDVELLDPALLEIDILRQQGPREIGRDRAER